MTTRAGRAALFAALLALLLALPVGPRPQRAQAQAPPLVWQGCGGGFECARLAVPLDYANPGLRRIEVALIRLPARKAAERIGPLLVNPGGPGGSGIEFLRSWAPGLPGEVRDRFDLVSFDPRGVGESTPLLCHDRLQQLLALPASPDTGEEWQQVVEETRSLSELCAQRGGALLPFFGTADAVRDMDQIRQALGADQISFLGYSYGTVLGAVYAEMFPQSLRALVLDGAVDLSLSGEEAIVAQTYAFEGALEHYLAYCRERRCLGEGDPKDMLLRLLARAADSPIPAPQADRPLGDGELTYAVLSGLYSDALWPALTAALRSAIDGNGSAALRLADRLLGRRIDGSYDNSLEMNAAVNCLDRDYGRDPEQHIALARALDAALPVFGAYVGSSGLICSLWPAEPSPLPVPAARGAPASLVIGTTGDPATPYVWAESMAKRLQGAVLLTFNGEGHTAYRRGDSCIDGAVNAYLLELKLPAAGTRCGSASLSQPLAVPTAPLSSSPDGSAVAPTPAPVPPPATASRGGDGGLDTTLVVVLVVIAGALVVAGLYFARNDLAA